MYRAIILFNRFYDERCTLTHKCVLASCKEHLWFFFAMEKLRIWCQLDLDVWLSKMKKIVLLLLIAKFGSEFTLALPKYSAENGQYIARLVWSPKVSKRNALACTPPNFRVCAQWKPPAKLFKFCHILYTYIRELLFDIFDDCFYALAGFYVELSLV